MYRSTQERLCMSHKLQHDKLELLERIKHDGKDIRLIKTYFETDNKLDNLTSEDITIFLGVR